MRFSYERDAKKVGELGSKCQSVTCNFYFNLQKWTDDSMAWNPNKFNGIDRLTFRQGQIWSPLLSVFK